MNGLPAGFILDSQPSNVSSSGYQPGQFWHNATVGLQDYTNPIIAAEHNFMNPIHGTAQLIEHGLGAVGIEPQSIVAQDDAAMAAREKNYQASVPDNFANNAGAVVGSIAPWVASGAAAGLSKVGGAATDILPKATPQILKSIVSGIPQGAAVAATNPVNDNSAPYSSQKTRQMEIGGLIGGTTPLVTGAMQGIYNAGKSAIQPFTNPQQIVGKALTEWIGSDPETLAELRAANEIVPGSSPTTAQMIANPDIVQAEKALTGNPEYKGHFMDRDITNNEARLNAIRQIAGSPEAVQQAIKDRAAATTDWIGPQGKLQMGNPVPVQPIIDSLNNLQSSSLSLRPTVGAAAKDMINDLQNRSFQIQGQSVTPGGYNLSVTKPMAISPADLDSLRQNAKDYLKKYAPNGAVSTQQEAAFVPVKNTVIDAIEKSNPGYRNYLATFAKYSAPINSMEAAQSILDNLDNRAVNASGSPQINLNSFNGQLAKALNTPYGVSPEAETMLNNVGRDLQRGTISNSVRTPGSDTNYNMQAPGWIGKQLYGPDFAGGSKLAKWTAAGIGGLAASHSPMAILPAAGGMYAGADRLANMAGSKVNSALAEALLNPGIAADSIEAYQASQIPKNAKISAELLKRLPQLGGLVSQ